MTSTRPIASIATRPARWWLTSAVCTAAVFGLASPALAQSGAGAAATPSLGPVRHVRANGLKMGYRIGGHGPTLIMVMGRSGTMAEWDPLLIDQLIRNHRVVIFDNRGMGTTNTNGVPANKVTIRLMAQDTLALANALHIEQFDLMGWSMGGEISQRVAVDAPSRVTKLVLCATSSGGPTEQAPSAPVLKVMNNPNLPAWTLFALSFPPTKAATTAAFGYIARVYAQYTEDQLPSDSFAESSKGRSGQQHARQAWVSSKGGVYNDLPKIKIPMLVMWGNLDIIDPPANDRLIASRVPNAKTAVFSGAGHAFLFQDARQVGKKANGFLG